MRILLSLVASGICYDDTAVKDMDAPKLHNWMKKLFRNEFSILIRIKTFSRPTSNNKDSMKARLIQTQVVMWSMERSSAGLVN